MTPTAPEVTRLRPSRVEVKNILHLMNLMRPDIRELKGGATLSCSITTLRMAADIIERFHEIPSEPDKWAQQNPEAWEALRAGRAGVYGIVEPDCWYDGKVPLIGSRIDKPFKSEVKEGV